MNNYKGIMGGIGGVETIDTTVIGFRKVILLITEISNWVLTYYVHSDTLGVV